jgi:hypothetical protein
MSTRGREPIPATVKIIKMVHVDVDQSSFKSVIQMFTGRDAVVGGRSHVSERAPMEGRGQHGSKRNM